MILEHVIKIKGNSRNVKYYKNLGYDISVGKEILINISDLSNGSTFKVKVQCDNCNIIKKIEWSSLYKYTSGDLNNKYYCSKCNNIKRTKTNQERYGGNSPTCDSSIVDKIKETNLEKWGSTSTLHSNLMKDKIKDIFIEKYGVDSPLKSKEIQDKCRNTLFKNYGVKSPLNSPIIYKRLLDTNNNRYGVGNIFENEYVKNTIINNQIEKWGKLYVKTDDMKSKSKETLLRKYGVEHYTHSVDYIKSIYEKEDKKYTDINFISYDKVNKKYNILCDKCNITYQLSSDMIYHRYKSEIELCLNCNPIGNKYVSSGELDIISFLNDNNIHTKQTDKAIINPYNLDIIIEEKKIAIEYNGIWWHNDNFKDKFYHNNKYNKCADKGWSLIQIWEDDWINKKDIVKSIILSKLGIYNNRIYARKCDIRFVSNNDKKTFLNNNHLQGNCKSSINIGLYYNDELVSLMTFGHRRTNSNDQFELIRFCNKLNTIIIGGASKLFDYFKNNYKYDKIISYSDCSYSDGNLYKTLKFKYMGTSINYYWCDGKLRYHRFNFNKKRLISQGYDKGKTEVETMRERGFSRIWGCGNKKWEF